MLIMTRGRRIEVDECNMGVLWMALESCFSALDSGSIPVKSEDVKRNALAQ